jgi:hypothetical protein
MNADNRGLEEIAKIAGIESNRSLVEERPFMAVSGYSTRSRFSAGEKPALPDRSETTKRLLSDPRFSALIRGRPF